MTAALVVVTVLAALLPVTQLRRGDGPDRLTAIGLVVLVTVAAVLARYAHAEHGAVAVVLVAAVAMASVTGGGCLVRTVLAFGRVADAADAGAPITEPDDPAAVPALRGGRLIGYLERAAVVVTLLLGWPEGLAVILAVKSLARYPELRDAHVGEQFIIGTFASVLWAAAMAGIGRLALS